MPPDGPTTQAAARAAGISATNQTPQGLHMRNMWEVDVALIADWLITGPSLLRTYPRVEKKGTSTMMTIDDILAERPVDRGHVEAHKARMLSEVRAHRLQELRDVPD